MITIEPKLEKSEWIRRDFARRWRRTLAWLESHFAGILGTIVAVVTLVGFFLPNLDFSEKVILAVSISIPVIIVLVCWYRAQHRDKSMSRLYCEAFHDIAHAIRSIHSREEETAQDDILREIESAIGTPTLPKMDTPTLPGIHEDSAEERDRLIDRLITNRIKDSVKRNLGEVCKVIHTTVKRRGFKIGAVTIKCRLDDRLIRIGQHGADKRLYPSPVSPDGCEAWQNSPFYDILSQSTFAYSALCGNRFDKPYRILAVHDMNRCANYPPDGLCDIIRATMNMLHTGTHTDEANDITELAKGICEDMCTRANNNYSACLGIPILPSSETFKVEVSQNGVPGFIGIDSKDAYVWDALGEDLVVFLAAVADLLHNIIKFDLIEAFYPSDNGVIPYEAVS